MQKGLKYWESAADCAVLTADAFSPCKENIHLIPYIFCTYMTYRSHRFYFAKMWPNSRNLKQREQMTQPIFTLLTGSNINASLAGKLIAICAPPYVFLSLLTVDYCKLSDPKCFSKSSRSSSLFVTPSISLHGIIISCVLTRTWASSIKNYLELSASNLIFGNAWFGWRFPQDLSIPDWIWPPRENLYFQRWLTVLAVTFFSVSRFSFC